MDDPPLNPSKQVERIREILVGRQMNQVEDRLRSIEEVLSSRDASGRPESSPATESILLEETHQLREQLREETLQRHSQYEQLSLKLESASRQLEAASTELQQHDQRLESGLSHHLEQISSAMASRIDARVREILQHLQGEIAQWKHQVDRDLRAVREDTVDRSELKNRFARLASAAMQDDPPPEDGFLL